MTEKKKTKKNPAKRITTILITVLMLGAIGYFVWEISKEVETTFSLISNINDAKKELAELQQEEAYLTQQKERLMDEDYLRVWARGEFLILEEGEELYKLPGAGN
jgi:cell division protein FtsB